MLQGLLLPTPVCVVNVLVSYRAQETLRINGKDTLPVKMLKNFYAEIFCQQRAQDDILRIYIAQVVRSEGVSRSEAVKSLPAGIYVIGNKKVIIR